MILNMKKRIKNNKKDSTKESFFNRLNREKIK